jgi:MFS family permease
MVFKRNIKLLRWHSFFTDFNVWEPLAIIYFSKISGSYALGLSIFSIFMVSTAIFELPTGFISDRYGRVKSIIFGSLAFLIGAIFYAIGLNYWFLAIGAIIQGFGRSCYSGNNDALLYDNLSLSGKLNEFEEYNGKIGSMSQIALAISAILSISVAIIPLSFLLWFSTIPQLICLLLSLKMSNVKIVNNKSTNIFSHIKIAIKNFISNINLRLISFSDIISFGLGEAGWNFKSAFFVTIWPTWAVGIPQFLSNVGASFSFHFSGKILKKFSALNVLIFDFIFSEVTVLIALIFVNVISPILMSINSLTYGVSQVATNKLLQDEFTMEQRATMGSLNSLAGSLLFGVFAVVLGIFADKFGPKNALIFQSILSFSVLYFYFNLKRRQVNQI